MTIHIQGPGNMISRYVSPLILALILAAPAFAQLATQRVSQDGVAITVTPGDLAKAQVWSFKVVLDTHSQDLSDDLIAASTLVDDRGGEAKPIAWEGAGPGGHHREGTLTFARPKRMPGRIELRIARAGETPRVFGWQLE